MITQILNSGKYTKQDQEFLKCNWWLMWIISWAVFVSETKKCEISLLVFSYFQVSWYSLPQQNMLFFTDLHELEHVKKCENNPNLPGPLPLFWNFKLFFFWLRPSLTLQNLLDFAGSILILQIFDDWPDGLLWFHL